MNMQHHFVKLIYLMLSMACSQIGLASEHWTLLMIDNWVGDVKNVDVKLFIGSQRGELKGQNHRTGDGSTGAYDIDFSRPCPNWKEYQAQPGDGFGVDGYLLHSLKNLSPSSPLQTYQLVKITKSSSDTLANVVVCVKVCLKIGEEVVQGYYTWPLAELLSQTIRVIPFTGIITHHSNTHSSKGPGSLSFRIQHGSPFPSQAQLDKSCVLL